MASYMPSTSAASRLPSVSASRRRACERRGHVRPLACTRRPSIGQLGTFCGPCVALVHGPSVRVPLPEQRVRAGPASHRLALSPPPIVHHTTSSHLDSFLPVGAGAAGRGLANDEAELPRQAKACKDLPPTASTSERSDLPYFAIEASCPPQLADAELCRATQSSSP